MAEFNFSLDEMMNPDTDVLYNKMASEQSKQMAPYIGQGQNLKTTRSQDKDLDPFNTTIFDASEILQNGAVYQNTAQVTAEFDQELTKYVTPATSQAIFNPRNNPLAYLQALLPDDINAQGSAELNALASPDAGSGFDGGGGGGFGGGGASGSVTPTTPEQQASINQLLSHPNLLGVYAAGKNDISSGKIVPGMIDVTVYLMNNGVKLYITCAISGHSVYVHGHEPGSGSDVRKSLHGTGRAFDIRPNAGGGSIASERGWIDTVYGLLDATVKPKRTMNVGGPYLYKGTGSARTDAQGTVWFTNADHQNHIHYSI